MFVEFYYFFGCVLYGVITWVAFVCFLDVKGSPSPILAFVWPLVFAKYFIQEFVKHFSKWSFK